MKTFTITALLALLCSFTPVHAQQTGEIGGEALQLLSRTDNGKYDRYVTEYKRMYAMYTGDDSFADYLTDGKKYTVIVPDNTAIEVYYRTEGSANGNPPRLRNTLKYNIIKGKYTFEAFKDGQTLYTLFPSHPLTVTVKKDKVYLTDKQGNRVRLDKSFESGNIIFYPVKTLLRY